MCFSSESYIIFNISFTLVSKFIWNCNFWEHKHRCALKFLKRNPWWKIFSFDSSLIYVEILRLLLRGIKIWNCSSFSMKSCHLIIGLKRSTSKKLEVNLVNNSDYSWTKKSFHKHNLAGNKIIGLSFASFFGWVSNHFCFFKSRLTPSCSE